MTHPTDQERAREVARQLRNRRPNDGSFDDDLYREAADMMDRLIEPQPSVLDIDEIKDGAEAVIGAADYLKEALDNDTEIVESQWLEPLMEAHGILLALCDGRTAVEAPADISTGLAPPSSPVSGGGERRVRHKKRGSTYTLVGTGKMQSEFWTDGAWPPSNIDMYEVVVYRADESGSLWVRPVAEFNDGRFEDIAGHPTQTASDYDQFGNVSPSWDQHPDDVRRKAAIAPSRPPEPAASGEAKPAAWVIRLQYSPEHWSGEMFTDVLPENDGTYMVVRPLYTRPPEGNARAMTADEIAVIEGKKAYNAGEISDARKEILDPWTFERIGKLPPWARAMTEDLVQRIVNLRTALALPVDDEASTNLTPGRNRTNQQVAPAAAAPADADRALPRTPRASGDLADRPAASDRDDEAKRIRAEVIEECAKWHDARAEYHDAQESSWDAVAEDPESIATVKYHNERRKWHEGSAASLRALAQPEQGGATNQS